MNISDLRIKVFADGADRQFMLDMYRKPFIKGFTTNPTLMRRDGVRDYEAFARDILAAIPDRPFAFEVFSDEMADMKRQALKIAAWSSNIYVKIPIANTKGISCAPLIRELAAEGVKLLATAVCTLEQAREASEALGDSVQSMIAIYAGRIADTGIDPVPVMASALEIMRPRPNQELLWGSTREVFNIFQADAIGCHCITVASDHLKKLALVGKDLTEYSLETVKMFYEDSLASGYTL
ncbi:transaldolase [bacterium]|nr:transaldolase [bacterium]